MSEPTNLSPWLTIWMHPKKTMRHILDNYPARLNHVLAICGAFTRVVTYSISWYTWWMTALIWLSLSIFSGLFALYVMGGLLKWTGNWLKGSATFAEVRSALAWAQIPVFIFFLIEQLLLWGVGGDGSNLVYASVYFIFALWASIIFLCCLAEAQKFSFMKALINYVLAAIIMIAIIVIVMLAISPFVPSDIPQTN